MSNKNKNKQHFFAKKKLSFFILLALYPQISPALELAQAPPGKVNPHVAPNIILSLDNSKSMDGKMGDKTRLKVLTDALNEVFSDTTLLPSGKVRLAWQVMHIDSSKLKNKMSHLDTSKASSDISTSAPNLMRVLDDSHRARFLDFLKILDTNTGTHTHKMVMQADNYMRAPIHKNGPWADVPGTTLQASGRLPLGCRRNYHVLLTDGEWNTQGSGVYHSTSPYNYDGTANSFPNPLNTVSDPKADIPYSLTDPQTQIYRDTDAASSDKSVVADWAFYSWANPLQLQSNLTGKVQPKVDYYSAVDEKFKTKDGTAEFTFQPFWNPRYNPATWPHMTTFTIGFSNDAVPEKNYNSSGKEAGSIKAPTSDIPYGYDGDFVHYAKGTYRWYASKDKGHDMWHAAINGRGEFYSVTKPDDLKKAFESIIGTINVQSEPDRSTSAATGTSAERKPVGTFTTYNDPLKAWSGGVKSHVVENGTETAAWDGKSTAEILNSRTTERVIITSNDASSSGVAFRWNAISDNQKNLLNAGENSVDNATVAENRLNYLRGDRSLEMSKTNGVFRNRVTIQGDIVNSAVWYVGAPISDYTAPGYTKFINDNKSRQAMIYVGGNDGMLHGFSATDGTEKIAYIPKGVYTNLSRLTWPSFDNYHRYYVDGSPMTGDVDLSSSTSTTRNWKTLLVGTLGGGGKGYFILDATDPESTFNENQAENLVIMDKTMSATETISCTNSNCLNTEAADIGHIFSIPAKAESNPLQTTQIALLNNNRWAAVLGNGYNSVNQRPVLLIQYLDDNKELLRIPATSIQSTACTAAQLAESDNSYANSCHNTTDNGLSAPTLVDINGDKRPDVVYAGDIKGNLWKFIIGSENSSDWHVAFNGSPLFTATGGIQGSTSTRNSRQPITVAPTVRANDRSFTTGSGTSIVTQKLGGMMVSFGTGRNISSSDPQNTDIQSVYSILDNTRYQMVKSDTSDKYYVSVHPGDASKNIPAPSPVGMGVSSLYKQAINITTKYTGTGDSEGKDYWKMDETNPSSIDWSINKGWYLDFPEMGERLLKPMDLYDGSNILAIYSQVPSKGTSITANTNTESCEPSVVDEERQYLTLINIMDGKRPSVQIMDMNGDGIYDLTSDNYVSRQRIVKGAHTRITGKNHITNIGKDELFNLARMPEQSMRPSWRQLK